MQRINFENRSTFYGVLGCSALGLIASVAFNGGNPLHYFARKRYVCKKDLTEDSATATLRQAADVQQGDDFSPLATTYNVQTWVVPSLHSWQRSPGARKAFAEMVHELQCECPILGIDGEWCKNRPIAVMQVASRRKCFIFQIFGFPSEFPPELAQVISDPNVIKCGVGVHGDAVRLNREYKLEMPTQCELGHLSSYLKAVPPRSRSLAAVTEALTGETLGKDMKVTLSNWEEPSLSPVQLAYAADDAICAVACMLNLVQFADDERERFIAEVTGRSTTHIAKPEDATSNSDECVARTKSFFADDLGEDFARKVHAFYASAKPHLAPEQDSPQDRNKLSSEEKRLAKIARKEKMREQRKANKEKDDDHAVADNGTSPAWQINGNVRVLSIKGDVLFTVDQAKARWYVDKKKLAFVTKRKGDVPLGDPAEAGKARNIEEIQLTFEPKVKTKLCMNWQLGNCPVGETCPFAHGMDDFNGEKPTTKEDFVLEVPNSAMPPTEADLNLANDGSSSSGNGPPRPTRPESCVICMATGDLLKHSVVPPSYRKFLPFPFNTGVADDFVLICLACNSRVRLSYDLERKRVEKEMTASNKYPDVFDISKTCRHSQLLANPFNRSTGERINIPEKRQEEMKTFIMEHLHKFYPPAAEPGFELTPEHLKIVGDIKVGDVHNAQIVDYLVGTSQEKAIEMIRGYRTMFVEHFRPQFVPWCGGAPPSYKEAVEACTPPDADSGAEN